MRASHLVLFLVFIWNVGQTKVWAEEKPFACALKIQAGEPERVRCRRDSGNKALNAKAVAYTRHLNGVFGIHAKACFLDDNPPNAWSRNDETILIGRNLIRKEFEEHGNVALYGILAHEWAHQMQYREKPGTIIGGTLAELQADCVAGYHLGMFGQVNQDEVTTFTQSLFKKGDYAFNSPTHHGTPDTRIRVMLWGYEKGREKITRGSKIFQACLEQVTAESENETKNPPPVQAIQN